MAVTHVDGHWNLLLAAIKDCPETVKTITQRDCAHEQGPLVLRLIEQSLRSGPLEARRTGSSGALAISWRMHGKV